MFRTLVAVALSASVLTAALRAPLVHAHPDDHDSDHHGAALVHAHLAGHATPRPRAPGGPAVSDPDAERPVFLQWFVAEAAPAFEAPAIPAASFLLAAPEELPARRPVRIAHGLDPPLVRLRPSRAPPLCL